MKRAVGSASFTYIYDVLIPEVCTCIAVWA